MLYYIFILHQTTTDCDQFPYIVQLYYIFILHQTTTDHFITPELLCCIISSFYIKPQLFTGNVIPDFCCIISSFYIKPQPN